MAALRAHPLLRLLLHRVTLTWLLVALVWVVAGIVKPGFAKPGHLRYLLELASVMGIVAAGQTLVVIAGGIDLSVAAVITFATMILPLLTAGWDTTGLVGAIGVLALTTMLGLLNGLGIVLLRVHPLILTLATATILQGALILIAGGSAISVNNATAVFLGNGKLLGLPMTIGTWIVVAVLATLLLHRTVMGTWLFAIGTNDRASRLAGVAVSPTLVAAYAISGFCAGLTGLLLLGMNRQGYVGIGEPYLLGSIAAVVLGGTSILGGRGTYLGTIAGSVLLVTITALITVVNASAGWRSILFGALILGLLLLSGRDRETR